MCKLLKTIGVTAVNCIMINTEQALIKENIRDRERERDAEVEGEANKYK